MSKQTLQRLQNLAVALSATEQTLVIETLSAPQANGVPTRRPSKRVQLVPFGTFAARDGRPAGMTVKVRNAQGQLVDKPVEATAWKLDNSQGWDLARRLNARHNPEYETDGMLAGPPATATAKTKTPKASFGFDYEHQSLRAEQNGQPAPRAGSGSRFEWVYDEGLYLTDVEWTPNATKAILDGEYLYVSPVLFFDPDTGVVLDLFNAALVHTPALQELAGLQVSFADLSARLGSAQSTMEDANVSLLEQLIARLGLPAGTTEAAALAALDGTRTGQQVAAAMGAALQLPADVLSDAGKAAAAAAELHAKATAPAPAASGTEANQAIAALSSEVAALKLAQQTRDVDALIDSARAAGKLVPSMEPWARTMGVAQLSAYLQAAPVIAPPQSGAQGLAGVQPPASGAALGADAASIAAQLGLAATDLTGAAQ
jgi:phage I-like protein